MEALVCCPYCGQENTIIVDESAGDVQEYVEDCQVCCKPWQVMVSPGLAGEVEVDLRTIAE